MPTTDVVRCLPVAFAGALDATLSMRCLLHEAAGVSAADYLSFVDGLYRAVEPADAVPRLGIFGLSGDALLLGRHQRAASAVDLDAARDRGVAVLRRVTGGRTVSAGEGTVAVLLALPHPSALLADPIPLAKVLNRHVRGVLGAMHALGAPTYYFGRDHVVVSNRVGGYASFDARATGPTVVEFLLGIGRPVCVAEGLSAYPPPEENEPPRPCATYEEVAGRSLPFSEVRAALVEAFGRIHAARLEPAGEAPRGELLPATEDEQGFVSSGVGEIAIGYLEALVRREGARIGEVRLRGDFICPAEAVARLEGELRGLEPRFEVIAPRVDAFFKEPFAAPLGIRHLRIVPDAIVAAFGD